MISIIIVHYKNEKDLFDCLNSLYNLKIKQLYEVIIVDNSENKNLQKSLLTKNYKNLKYISSPKNLGYGGGMNLGAKYAKGEYLFILNPDVVFKNDIISSLISKFKKNKRTGIISPLLYTTDNVIMEQGARELTPFRAIIKLSFIDKLFPNNPISKDYWVKDWEDKNLKEVDNVPGTALIISKELFDGIGGFDENFFLYFEEFDLCKRVREKGYKIFIDPTSKLIHKWGTSTKLLKNRDEIFKKSRYFYFKKHFGFLKAIIIESFLNINKDTLFLSFIFLSAFFIRLYKIDSLVPFIGDQGWFFISAKNAILLDQIPLVGITSSHLWLHQGPLWTYIILILFKIFNFNPIIPFIFTALVDGLVVILIYKLLSTIFSHKVALFSSLIYAFSPVVILSARMAYHTSLIPLFILLFFYSLFHFIKGRSYYFPLSIFFLAVLYNFELQTAILAILFFLILLFGFIKKLDWFKNILSKKILFLSFIAFLIPMFPILLYDIRNGFPQTIVFGGWILYKGISFVIKLFESGSTNFQPYILILDYFYEFIRKLLFMQNGIFSLIIFIFSIFVLFNKVIKNTISRKMDLGILLLFLFLLFLAGGILFSKTPSDAYLMSLFIPSVLIISIFLDHISKKRRIYLAILSVVLVISFMNVFNLISNDYFTGLKKNFGPNLYDRTKAVKEIIKDSGYKTISIIGKGEGSQFESFTNNYEYLLWFYGKNPQERNGEILYILSEGKRGITIGKR